MTDPFIPFDEPYRRAFTQAVSHFGGNEMISGIDVGFKPGTKALAVRVYCRATTQEEANAVFARVGSYVRITDAEIICLPAVYRAHAEPADRERHQRLAKVQPGMSVSHRRVMGGTIGLIVHDKSGARCILSNRHVLAGTPDAKPGDEIVQPATNFDGRVPRDAIGVLGSSILNEDGDAAIATLVGGRAVELAQFGTNALICETRKPIQDELVTKSGAKTGVTTGRVDGFGRYYMRYPGKGLIGINGFKIVPAEEGSTEELSSEGDSGAVWYSADDQRGLGLHIAGEVGSDPRAEMAIACFLDRVIDALELTLEPAATVSSPPPQSRRC